MEVDATVSQVEDLKLRKVAILCANNVQVDSRVRKIGRSALQFGFEPLIIGVSRSKFSEVTEFDGVRTVLVDNSEQRFRYLAANKLNSLPWGLLAYNGRDQINFMNLRIMAENQVYKSERNLVSKYSFRLIIHKYRLIVHQIRRLASSRVFAGYVRPGKVKYLLHRLKLRYSSGFRWAYYEPTLLDFSSLMIPELEKFSPDVIHANDTATIVAALAYKSRVPSTKIIYDVHEWVHGLPGLDPLRADAYKAIQDRYINGFDELITVSPGLAELIRNRYSIEASVIENVPWISDQKTDKSVRGLLGLGSDKPLIVYSGWVAHERGLDTVINALLQLPDVHLAIVAGRTFGYIENLLALAKALGVDDRVHVVGYVEPHEIPTYLASCDIGLIPLLHAPNHEIAIITKYYEYLHAGLPIICSDVREMAALTRELECGEVFTAGDVDEFVESTKKVLANRDDYAKKLTVELKARWSWQEQSKNLLDLYS